MFENLLTPLQTTVLDFSAMRAAEIGLLQRVADFKRLRHLPRVATSLEVQPIFSVLPGNDDNDPYAYINIDKVDSMTGDVLPDSGAFLGRLALPGAIESPRVTLPHDIFRDIDVYFALLRIQCQLEVKLPGIGIPEINPADTASKPSEKFSQLIKGWPHLAPKAG